MLLTMVDDLEKVRNLTKVIFTNVLVFSFYLSICQRDLPANW